MEGLGAAVLFKKTLFCTDNCFLAFAGSFEL